MLRSSRSNLTEGHVDDSIVSDVGDKMLRKLKNTTSQPATLAWDSINRDHNDTTSPENIVDGPTKDMQGMRQRRLEVKNQLNVFDTLHDHEFKDVPATTVTPEFQLVSHPSADFGSVIIPLTPNAQAPSQKAHVRGYLHRLTFAPGEIRKKIERRCLFINKLICWHGVRRVCWHYAGVEVKRIAILEVGTCRESLRRWFQDTPPTLNAVGRVQ